MNKRIKQLAEQAIEETEFRKNTGIVLMDAYTTKLAELIVKECTVLLGNAVDRREPASTYVEIIKEHFGI